jgi:hypothetical protein
VGSCICPTKKASAHVQYLATCTHSLNTCSTQVFTELFPYWYTLLALSTTFFLTLLYPDSYAFFFSHIPFVSRHGSICHFVTRFLLIHGSSPMISSVHGTWDAKGSHSSQTGPGKTASRILCSTPTSVGPYGPGLPQPNSWHGIKTNMSNLQACLKLAH